MLTHSHLVNQYGTQISESKTFLELHEHEHIQWKVAKVFEVLHLGCTLGLVVRHYGITLLANTLTKQVLIWIPTVMSCWSPVGIS